MCDTHFSWIRKCAATEKADIADGMVGRAEGPRTDKRFFAIEQAGDAVDFRCLDSFFQCHWRDDRDDPLGKHRLAGPGRSDHQNVMSAGHRAFNSALNMALA